MADISGYLQNIRNGARGEDVRDSIINALDKINKDNPSIIRPLNVTANGTYAGEGGVVYNPVTVNVPEGASQSLSLTDINITENGEFDPDDGQAYRKITVEVPQYVNEIMQEEKVIYLENGEDTYYAVNDGYDGYSIVHVMSGGGGGGGGATYYVDFLNADGSLLERVMDVPFGGGAVCHKPNPTSSGMRFVGWNPNPLNIRANTVCRPRFENIIYNPTQIQDTWADIAKKCHEDPDSYDIGMWKAMEFAEWRDAWNVTIPYAVVYMQLVAKGVDKIEGENGYANTTWIISNESPLRLYGNRAENIGPFTDNGTKYGWPGGRNRQRYQSDQFVTQIFPQDVIRYVKRVIKYSGVSVTGVYPVVFLKGYPSVDYFWAPSCYEALGGATDYPNAIGDSYSVGYNFAEDTGPVYDALFGSGDTMVNLQSHRVTNGYAWSTRTPTGEGISMGCVSNGAVSEAFEAREGFRLGFCI